MEILADNCSTTGTWEIQGHSAAGLGVTDAATTLGVHDLNGGTDLTLAGTSSVKVELATHRYIAARVVIVPVGGTCNAVQLLVRRFYTRFP